MKVPMKWLKEYVEIPMNAEEYASKMIMTGTAVEGVDKTGEQFEKVVVGYVVSCVDEYLLNLLDYLRRIGITVYVCSYVENREIGIILIQLLPKLPTLFFCKGSPNCEPVFHS